MQQATPCCRDGSTGLWARGVNGYCQRSGSLVIAERALRDLLEHGRIL